MIPFNIILPPTPSRLSLPEYNFAQISYLSQVCARTAAIPALDLNT